MLIAKDNCRPAAAGSPAGKHGGLRMTDDNKQKAVGSGHFIIHNSQFIIIYVYFSHRSNSASDGLLPYIKMPTR